MIQPFDVIILLGFLLAVCFLMIILAYLDRKLIGRDNRITNITSKFMQRIRRLIE
jgi:hypothetical protein